MEDMALERRWRRQYAFITLALFADGLLLFFAVGLAVYPQMLPRPFSGAENWGRLGYASLMGISGACMFSGIASGVQVTARIIGKRSLRGKVAMAAVFFVPVYLVMFGIFYNIPYGIYNAVKLKRLSGKGTGPLPGAE